MTYSSNGRLFLFVLALFVFFSLGATLRDLTFPDELRCAEVSREMLESGNWILPQLNFETYGDKPPLYFWLLSASMAALGKTVFAALFPSILAGVLTLLVTYRLGKTLFDPRTAWAGVWILSSFFLFLLMTQIARMDILLTLFTTAALACFVHGLRNAQGGRPAMLAGYLCIGAAILTKGPVGLIIPLMGLLVFCLWDKETFRQGRLYPGQGLLIMIAIPLFWLIPAALQGGGDYLHEILITQNAGRLVKSFDHAEPFYYYLLLFPLLFAPWSFYLLLYLDGGLRRDLARDRQAVGFLAGWLFLTLLFFSLLSGKSGNYLLPLTPAVALLVARVCTPLIQRPAILERTILLRSVHLLLGVCLCLCAVVLPAVPFKASFMNEWMNLMPTYLVFGAGGGLLLGTRRLDAGKAVFLVGATSLLLFGTVSFWLIPRINPYLSLKPMAERILTVAGPAPKVGGYQLSMRFLPYYTGTPYRDLQSTGDVALFFRNPGAVLIAEADDSPAVQKSAGQPLKTMGEFQIKRKTYLLLQPVKVASSGLEARRD